MSEPPCKKPRSDDEMPVKRLDEYILWKAKQNTKPIKLGGLSAQIFKCKGGILKEQIVSWIDGQWMSLQLYRQDVPGMDAVRVNIVSGKQITEYQRENANSLNTHPFDLEASS